MESYKLVVTLFLPFILTTHLKSLLRRERRYDLAPANDVRSVTVCNGAQKSISCANLQLIHVFNAFYGKLSGHDCERPLKSVRNQIPTCMSKDAASVIKETCQGQQSCDLYAEDSLYNNPCPTVNKYLFVSYACQGQSKLPETLKMFEQQGRFSGSAFSLPQRKVAVQETGSVRQETAIPESIQTAVVCSGQIGSISCPSLRLIKVRQVFFGKQQGRDCAGKLTRDSIPTCFAKDAIRTIRETCQGQQSCDLFSEADLYGRSLCGANTEQYLNVQYSCEGRSDLGERLLKSEVATGHWSSVPVASANNNAWMQSMAYYRSPTLSSQYSEMRPVTALQRPHQPWESKAQARSLNDPYNIVNMCAQCNGDCRNFLCYGCGGCVEPPASQLVYHYPYQRQDAVYHDAFLGNEMALSGMVIYPAPKLPWAKPKHSALAVRSKQYKTKGKDEIHYDDDDDEDTLRSKH